MYVYSFNYENISYSYESDFVGDPFCSLLNMCHVLGDSVWRRLVNGVHVWGWGGVGMGWANELSTIWLWLIVNSPENSDFNGI